MRYLKWGKAGYKLVCYSQQHSKPYLIRDPNCDVPAPFAEDVEAGVIQTLFAVAQEKLTDARKSVQSGSVSDMMQEQLSKAEAKLRRLYGLYGDSGDPYLLDTINKTKADIEHLKTSLADEHSKATVTRSALNVYQRLEGIQDAWPQMSVQERRTVLVSVIDRITISADYTDVKLKFGLSA